MAGFLMDGYRPNVAWFWEFVVLFRKLIILGVSLFIWEPFLQSFAAVVVIIAAIAVQLYFQPFELLALNLLELAALASLLATQLAGILMWYKQQPGRTDGAAWYRFAAIVALFATNFCIIAGFILVAGWYYLKQKSKTIVMWMPWLFSAFSSLIWFEEKMLWVCGNDLSPAQRVSRREEWSFFVSQQEGRLFTQGQAFAIRSKSAAITRRVAALGRTLESTLITLLNRDQEEAESDTRTLSDSTERAGSEVSSSFDRYSFCESCSQFDSPP